MRNRKTIRLSLLVLFMLLVLLFTACGNGTTMNEDNDNSVDDNTVMESEEPQDTTVDIGSSGSNVSDFEGKWSDNVSSELVVENGKALLTLYGYSIVGTAHDDVIEFPSDYKETEASIIDGKLVLTFTPFDYVIEQSELPEDYTTTITLYKVD